MALGFEKWNVYFRIYFVVMAKKHSRVENVKHLEVELWFKHEKMNRFLIAKSLAWNSTSRRLKFFVASTTGHFNCENMSWQKLAINLKYLHELPCQLQFCMRCINLQYFRLHVIEPQRINLMNIHQVGMSWREKYFVQIIC